MGIFSMCPACGSDWCSNCDCVRDKLTIAEWRLSALAVAIEKLRYKWQGAHSTAPGDSLTDELAKLLHLAKNGQ